MVTVGGLLSTVGIAICFLLTVYAREFLFLAAALIIVNWGADTLDGVLARQRNQSSRLGDYYDHVFDAFSVAIINIGLAFSTLVHPVTPLLLGVVFLLNFAITYKGEQVTGVYELLTFGPTEVRFALFGFFIAAYFVPGPVVSVFGVGLQMLDITCLIGSFWSVIYIVILFNKYARRLREADSQ
jgi:phosphatidylglycerophosphate synthase